MPNDRMSQQVTLNVPEPQIFLHCYEVVATLTPLTMRFPRPTRYVLGKRIDETAIDLLLQCTGIVKPTGLKNVAPTIRREKLSALSIKLDELRVLLRLSRDSGCLSAGQYTDIIARLKEIGMQIGGMIRAIKDSPEI